MSQLEKLAQLIRYYILLSTTRAGSGHPTSSLSAVELMTTLMFDGFFHYDVAHPDLPNNDRLIFSKGHASPLFYALWAAAGQLSEKELVTLRQFGSPLEGHPTLAFPFTEAPTGSLGQGLSIGVGMALNAKYLDKLPYRTFVLLGDSEMAEGSNWEAIQLAAHYKLDNLVGIIDVNRLGQRGETMYGHDVDAYADRVEAFGWEVDVVDGHSLPEIREAYKNAQRAYQKPVMIIAETIKGKGFSLWEDEENWHSKTLTNAQFLKALHELGTVDKRLRGDISKPERIAADHSTLKLYHRPKEGYKVGELVPTKKAYGTGLTQIFDKFPTIVALDAEVSNSTHAEIFADAYPERFFEMYIAEQNMVGVGVGLAVRNKIPFLSTFAAFFTRAFDQLRMAAQAQANIKIMGSYAGVSIGKDGASQMGLEDIAMARSLWNSVVLYPSDAVTVEKLLPLAAQHSGLVYMRLTREPTPVLYPPTEQFKIGGSKTVRQSDKDKITLVAAGITLHEALKACDELKQQNVTVRVIDLYSIKPIDVTALKRAARETHAIVVVEDHYPEGGIAEAVRSALYNQHTKVYSLAVTKQPKSGTPRELLDYEEISAPAIVKTILSLLGPMKKKRTPAKFSGSPHQRRK